MTDCSNLLERVKKDIRSILLTSAKGLPLNRLNREYRALVGSNICYQDLGYQVMEDFLRNIPDVVCIEWSSAINDYLLKGVADNSTKHIKKLVQRQRISKHGLKLLKESLLNTKPARSFKRARSSRPALSSTKPARTSKVALSSTKPASFSSSFIEYSKPPRLQNVECLFISTTQTPTMGSSPAYSVKLDEKRKDIQLRSDDKKLDFTKLKQEISELVKNSSDGLVSDTLCSAYNKKFGKALRFEDYGFETQEDCLEEIPGLLPRNVNGIVKIFMEPAIKSPKPSVRESIDTGTSYAWSTVDEVMKNPDLLKNPPFVFMTSNHLDNNINKERDGNVSIISESLKQKFRKILERYPHGIWAADFPNAFEVYIKEKFDLEKFGYCDLINLVDDLPSVFKRDRPADCKSDWKLYDARIQIKTSEKVEPEILKPVSTAVLDDVISNVRNLLRVNDDGIYLDDFVHVYYLNYDVPFSIKKLGFRDLEDFFLCIADKVPLKVDYSNVRRKIQRTSSSNFNFSAFSTKGLDRTPSDVVLPGAKYSLQCLPHPVKEGEFFPVYVPYVMNPGLIWIQLKGKETSVALQNVMDKLEHLYSLSSNDYMMLNQHIVIGAICAGIWDYDGYWYRVTIVTVAEDHVIASFIDYGNKGRISKTNLRYLRKDFIELPAQAIKARLGYVSPLIGSTWNKKAIDSFDSLMKKFNDKQLWASIIQTRLCPDLISVWLCDITKEEDFYVNKWLVDEGLAICCEEGTGEATPSCSSEQTQSSIPSSSLSESVPTSLPHTPNDTPSSDEIIKAVMTLLQCKNSANPVVSNDDGLVASLFKALDINKSQQTVSQPAPSGSCNQTKYFTPLNESSPIHNDFYHHLSTRNSNCPNSTSTCLSHQYMIPSASVSQKTSESNFESTASSSLYTNPCITSPFVDATFTDNDTSGSEIFEDDDDDEEFDKICEELGCVPRFVKRVMEKEYKIHIIKHESEPYVSSGDLSALFWPDEDADCLQRRLIQNNVPVSTLTVCEDMNPILFRQLHCLKVKGIKQIPSNSTIFLYRLEDVIPILNIFGHPSPMIRSELRNELKNFDPSSEIWKVFSEPIIDEDTDELSFETDTDKFNRRCVFDLKATLAGLQFKKLRLKKSTRSRETVDVAEEIKKLDSQFLMYEKRIKEIEALCDNTCE